MHIKNKGVFAMKEMLELLEEGIKKEVYLKEKIEN